MESSLIPTDPNPVPEGPSRYGPPRQARFVSALLALCVTVLMVLVLLYMAVLHDGGQTARSILTAMNLGPPPGQKQPNPTKQQQAAKARTTHQTQTAPAPKLPPHIDVNNPNKVEWPEGFVHTTHAEMAAGDISNIHSTASTGNANASTGGGGHGGGEGEGGNSFYNVDWYRKPPHSVFDSYMRPGQSTGRLAEIECRMIENYHVEDCHEVREEPRGTGMARVMREAAWQFLVRPPRLNGKPLLGTRVRITYTFTQSDRIEEAPRTGEAP
jgi:protein TonB